MKVEFFHSPGTRTRVRFVGACRLDETLVTEERCAAAFTQASDFDEFVDRVGRCTGTFAVIVRKGDEMWAAVDRLRSYPLFYGIRESKLYIADEADWVRGQVGDARPDPLAVGEMWFMLYCLGDRTIAPNVRQLTAGKALRARVSANRVRVEPRRYYAYLRSPEASCDEPVLGQLDDLYVDVFDELTRSAAGRQIVVPLSGGLDSRLVACMLKRMDYKNVLCFTYGRRGNPEVAVSERVARTLGYPWEFVPYRNFSLRNGELSDERERFMRACTNLHTIPPLLEDWLAVGQLRKQGILDGGAIFCPGHACIHGHKRTSGAAARADNRNALAELVLLRHSPRMRWERPGSALYRQMRFDVLAGLRDLEAFAHPRQWDPASLYLGWNWMERQSKRIINMVRVYEFWGYRWSVPLWDPRLMDFWCRLPLSQRQDKLLLKTYLAANSEKHFAGLFNDDAPVGSWGARTHGRTGELARRALSRCSATRYFFSDKNIERMLTGSYPKYLRRLGRRIVSLEPVTGPWLQMEILGCEGIEKSNEGKA